MPEQEAQSANEPKIRLILQWFLVNYRRVPRLPAKPPHPPYWGKHEAAELERSRVQMLKTEIVAGEVIRQQFAHSIAEDVVTEAIKRVDAIGTDAHAWVPIPGRDDHDFDIVLSPSSISRIPDESGPGYGSPEDVEARERVRAALLELQSALTDANLIGHNQPPEALDPDQWHVFQLPPIVTQLREEFELKEPRIPVVKQLAQRFASVAVIVIKWLGQKIDVAVNEAAKTFGKVSIIGAGAAMFEPHLRAAIVNAFEAVMGWLQIVMRLF